MPSQPLPLFVAAYDDALSKNCDIGAINVREDGDGMPHYISMIGWKIYGHTPLLSS
jgi:hypothetical protein